MNDLSLLARIYLLTWERREPLLLLPALLLLLNRGQTNKQTMAFLLRPFLNSVQEVDEDEKGGRGEERRGLKMKKSYPEKKRGTNRFPFLQNRWMSRKDKNLVHQIGSIPTGMRTPDANFVDCKAEISHNYGWKWLSKLGNFQYKSCFCIFWQLKTERSFFNSDLLRRGEPRTAFSQIPFCQILSPFSSFIFQLTFSKAFFCIQNFKFWDERESVCVREGERERKRQSAREKGAWSSFPVDDPFSTKYLFAKFWITVGNRMPNSPLAASTKRRRRILISLNCKSRQLSR